MFDQVNQIESAIPYIVFGLLLFFSSLIATVVFLSYKELRHGVYGMVIGTKCSEVYMGLHMTMNGIYGLIRGEEEPNQLFCQIDGSLQLFFLFFWAILNALIMWLSLKRRLNYPKLCKVLFFTGLIYCISIIIYSLVFDMIGVSDFKTCFIKAQEYNPSLLLACTYTLLLLISLSYNLWFFTLRDTSKDRNFINGYNHFIFISTLLYSILTINSCLFNYFNYKNSFLMHLSMFAILIDSLYISYFRWRIEYVQIVLKLGPSKYRLVNYFLLLFCCYKKPKFKEIKKVLNVRLIVSNTQQDLNDTIYSQLFKNGQLL